MIMCAKYLLEPYVFQHNAMLQIEKNDKFALLYWKVYISPSYTGSYDFVIVRLLLILFGKG